jgi:antitoxin Phd
MTSQTSHIWNTMSKILNKSTAVVTPTSPSSPNTAGDSWQIQSAKARFSEVFQRARTEGPQRVTRQGKEAVVMVAEEQYHRLVSKSRQPKDIVDFFQQSPLVGLDLDLKRDRRPARDTDLT